MEIVYEDEKLEGINSVILVPEKAIQEPGYITTLSIENDASVKHRFHSMAQMTYYQFQDHEIDVDRVDGVYNDFSSR